MTEDPYYKSSSPIEIGWCFKEEKSSSIFFNPEPNNILKDHDKDLNNITKSSHLDGVKSCPAVKSLPSKLWVIKCPYSIKLRAKVDNKCIKIVPIYPFTEVSQEMLPSIIAAEPRELWINPRNPIIQFKMPYIFFSDTPAFIYQLEAPMSTRIKNWSLIQGEIDIYNWQRPLNLAIQWIDITKDFEIKRGDPAFQIMAASPNGNSGFKLRKITPNDQLKSRIESCEGVTSLTKNTKSIMHNSRPSDVKFLN